ncbi:uncharacterized protein LOC121867101 [Homarus americanus]|uniref:uncharacterized protein LOC121867101 n=1 Tax=Homarus americanus TaxID=6706 RepID=UPI001C490ABF|nr:uncharacterized protein LOC121867101 [Homarus americanus]
MSAKRKPRTPTPPLGKENADEESEDLYAGRRVSVSEFDAQDFDCESVSSPGASSTSSEPGYVRQPGFEHHAHEFRATPPTPLLAGAGTSGVTTNLSTTLVGGPPIRTSLHKSSVLQSPTGSLSSKGSKKKKSNTHEARGDNKSDGSPSPNPARPRGKKDPLPMKLRALPQSFWLQPNKNNNLPPSCSTLPPLILGKDSSDVIDVRPVTPPAGEGREHKEMKIGEWEEFKAERMIKVGNTDLLSRLFDSVEQVDKKKVAVVRRGRPKKPPSTVLPRVLRDDDPCLVSTFTESILPLLKRIRPPSPPAPPPPLVSVLEMINLRDGDRTISLPSLNVEHNYTQILSELVLKL